MHVFFCFIRTSEQPEGRAVEQEAHIEGALAAEASLVVLDTLECLLQADGGGGKVVKTFSFSQINCRLNYRWI